jgi:hypothetical protein
MFGGASAILPTVSGFAASSTQLYFNQHWKVEDPRLHKVVRQAAGLMLMIR